MKGQRKKNKIPALARVALAENVKLLMEDRYHGLGDKVRALAKEADIGPFTVERLIKGTTGANLDTIEAVGKVLKAEPYELLTPFYAKRRLQRPPLRVAASRAAG